MTHYTKGHEGESLGKQTDAELARRMGEAITLDTSPGEYASFTLSLPAKTIRSETTEPVAPAG